MQHTALVVGLGVVLVTASCSSGDGARKRAGDDGAGGAAGSPGSGGRSGATGGAGAGGTSGGAPGTGGATTGGSMGAGGAGDGGSSAEGGPDADAAVPADASSDGAASCVPLAPCATNPGAPCRLGRTACGDVETCVDGPAAGDGTTCTDGVCVSGTCAGPTTLAGPTNLSASPVTPGRTCAEAPQYAVVAVTAGAATLAAPAVDDCIVTGDEMLLINLQGAPGATASVGNWELLTVDAVNGTVVTFTSTKTRTYGEPAGTDLSIGSGVTDQKVALVRVPRFGALTVPAGAELTAAPWNGTTGGVVALRAASLDVQGTITAAVLGYRAGAWSTDSGCLVNVATEAGESIAGRGSATTSRNAGASGGLSAASGPSFHGNTPLCASAGHAVAGEVGANPNGRTLGEPGAAYGVGDGSRLTMGSGPGGGLTCDGFSAPRVTPWPNPAGGIVLVLAGSLTVGASGAITATPPNSTRDIASSGGYVLLRGGDLSLGAARVTAGGAVGSNSNTSGPNTSNAASPGYIVIDATGTVTGTTDPVANVAP